MPEYITNEIEISFYDSDRKDSDEKIMMKKILIKNKLMKKVRYRTVEYNSDFKQFMKYSYNIHNLHT